MQANNHPCVCIWHWVIDVTVLGTSENMLGKDASTWPICFVCQVYIGIPSFNCCINSAVRARPSSAHLDWVLLYKPSSFCYSFNRLTWYSLGPCEGMCLRFHVSLMTEHFIWPLTLH